MINPEHYQILAARLAIDLMRTEPQKRLPYMTENLRELILQLNKPSPNYPDDQAYAQKREDMKNASNQKRYAELVKRLKTLSGLRGGAEAAASLAQEWRAAYPRRRAMLEELKKAGF